MQCDNPPIEAVASEKIQKPHPLLTFGVFAAIFLVTFLPCFLHSYGLLDDYYFLFLTLTKGAWCPEIVGSMLSQGRPLNLPFIAAAFSPMQGINDLVYIRIIATLGTAFLAMLFFRHAMHTGWSRAQSFVLSLLVFSQLPFQVISSWGLIGFLGAFRLPLGYGAYFLAKYAGEKPRRSPSFVALYAASVVVLAAAMAMHQTTAMFFWIGLAQDVLSPKRWEVSRRQLGVIFTTFGIACGIEYAICAWGKSAYSGYLLLDRDRLSLNVFEKIVWFFQEPLTNALNFNNLDANPLFAIAAAATILTGLRFYFQKAVSKDFLKVRCLLLAALPFLCYTPNLVVAENWSSYRTLCALAPLMVIYSFCAIQGIANQLKVGNRIVTASLLAAALLNLLIANHHVAVYFAEPQSRELALLQYRLGHKKTPSTITHTMDQLKPPKGKGPFDIWKYDSKTILPTWYETLAPAAYYDEFGRPSSARPYVAKAMVGLLQRALR